MKKFFYSRWIKGIVALLLILTVVSASLIFSDFVVKYSGEETWFYGFESNYKESGAFDHLLLSPAYAVVDSYHRAYEENSLGDQVYIAGLIRKNLDEMPVYEKINFYVRVGSYVYSDSTLSDLDILTKKEVFYRIERDEKGNIETTFSSTGRYIPAMDSLWNYGEVPPITVCTAVKDSVLEEGKIAWQRQEQMVLRALTYLLIHVVLAVMFLCYLLITCGKNGKGERVKLFVDRFFTEVHFAMMAFAIEGFVLSLLLLEAYVDGHFLSFPIIYGVIAFAAALATGIILASLLSIVRCAKEGEFLKKSILWKVGKWAFGLAGVFFRAVLRNGRASFQVIRTALSRKAGVLFVGALFVYTALIGLCGIGTRQSPFPLFLGVLLFLFASYGLSFRVKDLEEIKKGASKIRFGDLSYQIPEMKCEDLKPLAEDINDIARGLEGSVEKTLKAERMKTELITNVSHDLKTPLTSIINYTQLLMGVEDLPDSAKDYARIIEAKSDRLKKLTQDLFDISKAQSGNETASCEKLDAALLLEQALGELDSEIHESGLSFCVRTEKELFFFADGRKMSRVVSNLIHNILKYTMQNTRVFLLAYEDGGEVVMEFKNISSYPMDFSPEEIVGRFVRGDESRTEEGNGLGLAIAKSYIELCGGRFEIVTDGDLFKAIIRFAKYQ